MVMVGLDNAGKTTLIHTLKGEPIDTSTPTWGFRSETLMDHNLKMEIFDLGGGKSIRKIWERYYAEIHGAIFVLDAADPGRSEEAKVALQAMLSAPYLSGKPILIFANKQDLPKAMSASDTAQALGLTSLQNTRHHIVPCTAKMISGQSEDPSLKKGLKWMQEAIASDYSKLHIRVEQDTAVEKEKEEKEKEKRRSRVASLKAERLKEEAEANAKRAEESGEAESSGSNGVNTIGPGGVNENAKGSKGVADSAGGESDPKKNDNYNDGLLNSVQMNGNKGGTLPPVQGTGSMGSAPPLRPMSNGGGGALLEPLSKESSAGALPTPPPTAQTGLSCMPGGVSSPAPRPEHVYEPLQISPPNAA
eukprot:CAMPEP_0197848708 /NCGR_PEP_ID=MMETSP1438-20131217/9715_1 /TAXON_ID=1461541 /ORGANISM="Pterosperma sp., Strain CCMP1384" /LENGTH=361 /DNA_ID=CAMNT_0043461083 /DNA_START=317 /DNA_END=1402 /DNA_ORIENTATION=+